MKAKEFKRFFTDPNKDDLSSKYGKVFKRTNYVGNYKCLLCGLPHRHGLRYIIGQEEHIICHICHEADFNTKRRIRTLGELKKQDF